MEYKGYSIARERTGLFEIKLVGRGSAPKPLRGSFTSEARAVSAIDNCPPSKEKSSGKAEISS